MKNSKQTIGQRIKELREAKGLTQSQLAEKLAFSDKAVSKWETGGTEPDSGTMVKLSEIFNVSLDFLLKGETSLKETDAISKMELACREDNIALLVELDLDAFDSTGKNIDYYANVYNANNILSYLNQIRLDQKIDRYEKIHNNDETTFYICALEEGIADSKDLVMLLKSVKREDVAIKCLELEKNGYHDFRIFSSYRNKSQDYCDLDYEYFSMNCIGNNFGKRSLFIDWSILNDGKSAVVSIKFFTCINPSRSPETMQLFANEESMRRLFDLFEAINFKNWKNKHWGMPIYNVNYLLKGPLNNEESVPGFFYSNPGKEIYQKFLKGLSKFFFEIMNPQQYKKFVLYFNDSCVPYFRAGMKLEDSKKLFKEFESEEDAISRQI